MMPDDNPSILLVEGKEDKHVILALRDIHSVPNCFSIKDMDGIDPLLQSVTVYARTKKIVGIVVDADLDLAARWAQLRDRLRPLGFEIPLIPPPTGYIGENTAGVKLGMWIMPDNQIRGIMEDFLEMLIDVDDPLYAKVVDFIDSLPTSDERRFDESDKPKAKMYTWLAIQKQPGRPLGQSLTLKFFNTGNDQSTIFGEWLKQLFT